MELQFSNVDLVIKSSEDLSPLSAELNDKTNITYCGPTDEGNLINLEVSGMHTDPNETAHEICRVIEQLSDAGKQRWNAASQRTFDAGYEVAVSHGPIEIAIRWDTLQRIVALGANFAVTLYPSESAVHH